MVHAMVWQAACTNATEEIVRECSKVPHLRRVIVTLFDTVS